LTESPAARDSGLNAPWPASRRAIKYFARCLLMPEDWIRALPQPDRTPDAVSEIFQVTSYDAIIRLAELGLPVPADLVIYTEAEWEQMRAEARRFARTVEAEAVWLYPGAGP
jgi:Zn-dependent peptidase ImmA (M78 family)